jgi:hypothetical protein
MLAGAAGARRVRFKQEQIGAATRGVDQYLANQRR